MTQGIVLKSFEELGRFAGLILTDEEPSETTGRSSRWSSRPTWKLS